MTTPAQTQTLADMRVYEQVIAAGFVRPIGPNRDDHGAIIATAIMLTNPGTDPALLWRQWSTVPAHDPTRLSGYRPEFHPNSPDPIYVRAFNAGLVAETTGALRGAAGTIAGVAVPGVATATGQIGQGVGQGLAAALNPFADLIALLHKLGDPKVWLRVALAVGGGLMIVMGAYTVVEHTGAGAALTKTLTQTTKGRRT